MEVRQITSKRRILKNRYCLIEYLGAGGRGTVYLARDLELGTFWAVKELPLSDKKEAELMKNLCHPGIPRMIDYVEAGQYCYLVMEYIKGCSLRKCLSGRMPFSGKQVLRTGIEAAEILEYLHQLSPPVCYGDLKPENLILSETGRLYLIDFGSARHLYADRKREVLGTPGYAAPEQFEGYLRPDSDVYSLGKMLRELWTIGYGKPLQMTPFFLHFSTNGEKSEYLKRRKRGIMIFFQSHSERFFKRNT